MSDPHAPVGTPEKTPENLRPAWQPGQSGNPDGRPRRRPLTDALKAELEKPARGKGERTKRQVLLERLVSIALTGKRSESLKAMQLIFAYTDGLPVQTVELDVYEVAKSLAEQRGLPPEKVVSLLDQVKRRRAS